MEEKNSEEIKKSNEDYYELLPHPQLLRIQPNYLTRIKAIKHLTKST